LIAARAGRHRAQPILRRYALEGTVGASLARYNTREDVDCLVSASRQIITDRGHPKV
jgi:cysteine desulfurase/selenocysteine lyase